MVFNTSVISVRIFLYIYLLLNNVFILRSFIDMMPLQQKETKIFTFSELIIFFSKSNELSPDLNLKTLDDLKDTVKILHTEYYQIDTL